MSAYPTYQLLRDSALTKESGVEQVRATNGSMKLRSLWPTDKATIEAGHLLTNDERAALAAFYAAERNNVLTFVWRDTAESFNVVFASPPQYIKRGLQRYEVRVRLAEV